MPEPRSIARLGSSRRDSRRDWEAVSRDIWEREKESTTTSKEKLRTSISLLNTAAQISNKIFWAMSKRMILRNQFNNIGWFNIIMWLSWYTPKKHLIQFYIVSSLKKKKNKPRAGRKLSFPNPRTFPDHYQHLHSAWKENMGARFVSTRFWRCIKGKIRRLEN